VVTSSKIKSGNFMVKFLAFNEIDTTKVFFSCYFNMKPKNKS